MTLRRFWTMVAHYHGQVLKVSELARSLGSSEPTARRYLDILCGTYVVHPGKHAFALDARISAIPLPMLCGVLAGE